MTPQTSVNVNNILAEVIRETEQEYNYVLSAQDYTFLHRTMVELVRAIAAKFVCGGKEHNAYHESSFVTSVNHLEELQKEFIDGLMYSNALRYIIADLRQRRTAGDATKQ